jgi:hypothetical protein
MPICCTCALLSKNSVPVFFCAASSPCNEYINGCVSVAVSKPMHSHVPLAVREFSFVFK